MTIDDLLDFGNAKIVDPEFIGKVFESLLACLDSDSKESRRKITGSFYTPREIVSYMVNESLDEYLKTNDDLLQCKILDPACGSGAFPCGVMNEIMFRIDPNKELSQMERYRKKLDILRNIIYGVDIQPMAVQIAILRLFLSLIQEIVPDKKKDNFGIEPLPNLETKFVCANTLIGLKYEKQGQLQAPVVKQTVKQLQETRSQYFTATAVSEKERLKKYDETLRETLSIAMEADGEFGHDTALRLAQWNPYDQTKSADFFDPMWMFGIEKFDIVIGNPPYDVIENKNSMKADYNKHFPHLKSGRLNIYQCFFGKGTELLSTQGILAFIHPKALLADAYLAATREYLLKEYPSFTIVNIVNRRSTFSSVLQSVIVSQWTKGLQTPGCRIGNVTAKNDLKKMQYLVKAKKDIVTKHGTLLISNNAGIYKLEKKIRNVKSITLHFVTGCTEWNKIKDHLSDKPKKDAKRFIYGENIQRFYFAPSNKRISTSFIDDKVNVPTVQQLAILTQRTTAIEQPYRIIATIFDPENSDIPIVAENHTNVFSFPLVTENGTNVWECKDKGKAYYILGILNSRLMDFYFRLHNSNTHVSSGELNRLPIIDVSAAKQRSLAALVERRLNGEDVDEKIDALVYKLYALTAEEIAIVESSNPQR
ncbi:hypothetical protein FACS1894170_12260 [Planctomycetales bacterium]|nr:hypothetical protein FACS1894170_12260 [Planctomycetales bacterium]